MNSCVICHCLAAGLSGQAPDVVAPPPIVAMVLPPVPISHHDFACAFQPAPGKYEVVFIHPVTCCPVPVCFDLPCGCPKVHAGKRTLEFDYGRHVVVIRFQIIRGKVKVIYS